MKLIPREDVDVGEIIGEGGESTVHKGTYAPSGTKRKPVAIKKILKTAECKELKTLSRCSHPNIIYIFGFVESVTELLIVMELCPIGSLRSFLEKLEAPLPSKQLLDWVLQSALPIEYLHGLGIIHKDVKTDNYVITSNMVLKLTDFGISKDLNKTISRGASTSGTWRWMAPERHDSCLSFSADVFSLALVWWSLVARKLPFAEYKTPFNMANAIKNGIRPIIPHDCPSKLSILMSQCWHNDRTERPKIKMVVEKIQIIQVSAEKRKQDRVSVFMYSTN